MSTEEILELVKNYMATTLDGFTERRRKQGISAYLPKDMQKLELSPEQIKGEVIKYNEKLKQGLYGCIQTNDFNQVMPLAKKMIGKAGGVDINILCEFLLKTQLEISSVIIDRMQDNYSNNYDNFREQLNALPSPVNVKQGTQKKMKLSALWADYSSHKRKRGGGWEASSLTRNQSAYNQIMDIMGDRYITDIDRKIARNLKDMLQLYPYKKADNAAFRDKPFSPAMAKHKEFEPLSVGSMNTILGLASSMFNFAIAENYCGLTYNPFLKLQFPDEENDQDKREPYDQEDLAGLYRGLSTVIEGHPEKYWVPLICLYSGMRIDEACQLRTDDIDLTGKLPYFDVCHKPESKQKTKNKHNRTCPVHPVLIEKGFLEYVQKQRAAKRDRLFSRLTFNVKKSKWSLQIERWYNRNLEPKFVGEDRKKSFHSTRHTFLNWFKQNANLSLTQLSVIQSMVGHKEDGGITLNQYGAAYAVEKQYEVLSLLDYGVDLRLLKKRM